MTITHPTRSRLLSIFFILTATFSLTGIVLIDQFSPTTIPIIADIEERDGQISIPSNTTTTRSTYTPPTIIQARPDRPTVIVNPASTTTSTPPKQDKPPAPTTTRDILEDAYNQQYDEDNRYGDLQDDDSYMGPNEYTASDGLGVISGTYIAPNGKRYDVATAATARASAQHTETVSEIISNLSTEEFDSLINNIKQDIQDNNEINNIGDISDQDAFNQLFNQTLIYDESTREFILAEQEYNAQGFQAEFDSEEKRTSYFNNFNLYLNQAYKLLAGDEAFIVNCTGGESTLDSQCQKALKQAKDALAELGDTDNGYTNTTQYIELQLALDALTNNASGRGSVFQTNLDSITNTSLRNSVISLAQAANALTLSNAYSGCQSIISPDVRNACLSRYATEVEQDSYSYDGTVTSISDEYQTIQESYEAQGLITEEVKTSFDTTITDSYATSKLKYLIAQRDQPGNTTYNTTYNTTTIENQMNPFIEMLSESEENDQLSCRAHNGVWIGLDPDNPCVTSDNIANTTTTIGPTIQRRNNLTSTATLQYPTLDLSPTPFQDRVTDTSVIESCGQSNQSACNTGNPCDDGHYLRSDVCQLDPQLNLIRDKSATLVSEIYQHTISNSLNIDELTTIITSLSITNGFSPDDISSEIIKSAQSSSCSGANIYMEGFNQFQCIPSSALEYQFNQNQALAGKTTLKRGDLNQKCTVLFKNCNGGLSCNESSNVCELSDETALALALSYAVSEGSSGLTDTQLKIISLNSPTSFTSDYIATPELVRFDAYKQEQDDTFFSGGGCWLAVDPGHGVATQLPSEYCAKSTKQAFLTTIPSSKCHSEGGYYATGVSGGSNHGGIDNCYINTNSSLAGVGETVEYFGAQYQQSCAPGLTEFQGVCREQISLANDPEYAGGVVASNIADTIENWGNSTPILGHIPKLIGTFASAAIRAVSPSYNQSIEVRAEFSLAQRDLINNHATNRVRTSVSSGELTALLDEATAARESEIINKEIYQQDGYLQNILDATKYLVQKYNPFSTTEKRAEASQKREELVGSYAYTALINSFQVISTWTGEPPISRGGAAGTNAGYEFAGKSNELNASGEAQFTWDRVLAAGKPAYQAAFVAGDVIPGVAQAGKFISKIGTKTANTTLSTILKTTGKILVGPEDLATGIVNKTFLRYGNEAVENGFKALLSTKPVARLAEGAGRVFTPISNFTKQIINPEKYLTESIENAFLSTTRELTQNGTTVYSRTGLIQDIVGSLDNSIQTSARELLEQPQILDDLLHLPPSSGSVTIETLSLTRLVDEALPLIEAQQAARRWGLTLTDDSLRSFSDDYAALTDEIIAGKRGPLTQSEFVERFASSASITESQARNAFTILDLDRSPLIASRTIDNRELTKRLVDLGVNEEEALQRALTVARRSDDAASMVKEYQSTWSKLTNRTPTTPTVKPPPTLRKITNPSDLTDARTYLTSRLNSADREISAFDFIDELTAIDGHAITRDDAITIVSQLIDEGHPALYPDPRLGAADNFIPDNPLLAQLSDGTKGKLASIASPEEATTISTLLSQADQPIFINKTSSHISITKGANLDDSTRAAITKINQSLDSDVKEITQMLGWKQMKPEQVRDSLIIRLKIATGDSYSALINTELPGFGKTAIDDLITHWGLQDHGIVIRNQATFGAVLDVTNPRAVSSTFIDQSFIQLDSGNFYQIKRSGSNTLLGGTDRILINNVDELANRGTVIFTTMDESGWKAAMGKGVGGYSGSDDLSRFYYELTQSNPYQLFDEAHLASGRQWVVRLDSVEMGKMNPKQLQEHFHSLKPKEMENILDEALTSKYLDDFRALDNSIREKGESSVEHLLRPDGKPLDTDLYRSTHLEFIDQQIKARSTSRDAKDYLLTLRNQLDEATTLTEFDDFLRSATHRDNIPNSSVQQAIDELGIRQQAGQTVWDMRGKKVPGDDYLQNIDQNKIEYAKRAIATSETPQSVITQFVEELEGRRVFEELGNLSLTGNPSINDFSFALNQITMTPQELMQRAIGQTATAERIIAALDAGLTGSKIPPLMVGEVVSGSNVQNITENIFKKHSDLIKDNSLFVVIEDGGLSITKQKDELIEAIIKERPNTSTIAVATSDGYQIIKVDGDGYQVIKINGETSKVIQSKQVWENEFLSLNKTDNFKLKDGLDPENFVMISERTSQFDPTILPDAQPVNFFSELTYADNAKQTVGRYRGFSVIEDASIKGFDNKIKYLTDKGYTVEQASNILNKKPIYAVRQVDQGIIDVAGHYHPADEFANLTEQEIRGKIAQLNPRADSSIRITATDGKRYNFFIANDQVNSYALELSDDFAKLFGDNLNGELKHIRLEGDLTRLRLTEEQVFDQIATSLKNQLDSTSKIGNRVDELFSTVKQDRLRTYQFQQSSFAKGEISGAQAYYNSLADYQNRLTGLFDELGDVGIRTDSLASELGFNKAFISQDEFTNLFNRPYTPSTHPSTLSPQALADNFLSTRSYQDIPRTYISSREQYAVVADFSGNLNTLTNSTGGVARVLSDTPRLLTPLTRSSAGTRFLTTLATTRGITSLPRAISSLFSTGLSPTNLAIHLHSQGINATTTQVDSAISTANSLNLSTRDTYNLATHVLEYPSTLSPNSIIKLNNGQIRSIEQLLEQHGEIRLKTLLAEATITNMDDFAAFAKNNQNITSLSYSNQIIPANQFFSRESVFDLLTTGTENQRQAILEVFDTPYTPPQSDEETLNGPSDVEATNINNITPENTATTINWDNNNHSLNLNEILLEDGQSITQHLQKGNTVVIVRPDNTRLSIEYYNGEYIIKSPGKRNTTKNITRLAENYLPLSDNLDGYHIYVTDQNLNTISESTPLSDLLLADYNLTTPTPSIWQRFTGWVKNLFSREQAPPTPTPAQETSTPLAITAPTTPTSPVADFLARFTPDTPTSSLDLLLPSTSQLTNLLTRPAITPTTDNTQRSLTGIVAQGIGKTIGTFQALFTPTSQDPTPPEPAPPLNLTPLSVDEAVSLIAASDFAKNKSRTTLINPIVYQYASDALDITDLTDAQKAQLDQWISDNNIVTTSKDQITENQKTAEAFSTRINGAYLSLLNRFDPLLDSLESLNPKLKGLTQSAVQDLNTHGFGLTGNISRSSTLVQNYLTKPDFTTHFQTLSPEEKTAVLSILRGYSSSIRQASRLAQPEAEEIEDEIIPELEESLSTKNVYISPNNIDINVINLATEVENGIHQYLLSKSKGNFEINNTWRIEPLAKGYEGARDVYKLINTISNESYVIKPVDDANELINFKNVPQEAIDAGAVNPIVFSATDHGYYLTPFLTGLQETELFQQITPEELAKISLEFGKIVSKNNIFIGNDTSILLGHNVMIVTNPDGSKRMVLYDHGSYSITSNMTEQQIFNTFVDSQTRYLGNVLTQPQAYYVYTPERSTNLLDKVFVSRVMYVYEFIKQYEDTFNTSEITVTKEFISPEPGSFLEADQYAYQIPHTAKEFLDQFTQAIEWKQQNIKSGATWIIQPVSSNKSQEEILQILDTIKATLKHYANFSPRDWQRYWDQSQTPLTPIDPEQLALDNALLNLTFSTAQTVQAEIGRALSFANQSRTINTPTTPITPTTTDDIITDPETYDSTPLTTDLFHTASLNLINSFYFLTRDLTDTINITLANITTNKQTQEIIVEAINKINAFNPDLKLIPNNTKNPPAFLNAINNPIFTDKLEDLDQNQLAELNSILADLDSQFNLHIDQILIDQYKAELDARSIVEDQMDVESVEAIIDARLQANAKTRQTISPPPLLESGIPTFASLDHQISTTMQQIDDTRRKNNIKESIFIHTSAQEIINGYLEDSNTSLEQVAKDGNTALPRIGLVNSDQAEFLKNITSQDERTILETIDRIKEKLALHNVSIKILNSEKEYTRYIESKYQNSTFDHKAQMFSNNGTPNEVVMVSSQVYQQEYLAYKEISDLQALILFAIDLNHEYGHVEDFIYATPNRTQSSQFEIATEARQQYVDGVTFLSLGQYEVAHQKLEIAYSLAGYTNAKSKAEDYIADVNPNALIGIKSIYQLQEKLESLFSQYNDLFEAKKSQPSPPILIFSPSTLLPTQSERLATQVASWLTEIGNEYSPLPSWYTQQLAQDEQIRISQMRTRSVQAEIDYALSLGFNTPTITAPTPLSTFANTDLATTIQEVLSSPPSQKADSIITTLHKEFADLVDQLTLSQATLTSLQTKQNVISQLSKALRKINDNNLISPVTTILDQANSYTTTDLYSSTAILLSTLDSLELSRSISTIRNLQDISLDPTINDQLTQTLNNLRKIEQYQYDLQESQRLYHNRLQDNLDIISENLNHLQQNVPLHENIYDQIQTNLKTTNSLISNLSYNQLNERDLRTLYTDLQDLTERLNSYTFRDAYDQLYGDSRDVTVPFNTISQHIEDSLDAERRYKQNISDLSSPATTTINDLDSLASYDTSRSLRASNHDIEQSQSDINHLKHSLQSHPLTVLHDSITTRLAIGTPFTRRALSVNTPSIQNQLINIYDQRTAGNLVFNFKLTPEEYARIQEIFDQQGQNSSIEFVSSSKNGTQSIPLTDALEIIIEGASVKLSTATRDNQTVISAQHLVQIELPTDQVDQMAFTELASTINTILENTFKIYGAFSPSTQTDLTALQLAQYAQQAKTPINKLTNEQITRALSLKLSPVYPYYQTFIDQDRHLRLANLAQYATYHSLSDPVDLVNVLQNGGLMASSERYGRGTFVEGMSSMADTITGGADNVFTRTVVAGSNNSADHMLSGGIHLVLDPQILNRTDWYAYSSDQFGSKKPEIYQTRQTPEELIQDQLDKGYSSSNEQMFSTGIDTRYITKVVVNDQATKDTLIALLTSSGIDSINGNPLESIITISTHTSDLPDYAWKNSLNPDNRALERARQVLLAVGNQLDYSETDIDTFIANNIDPLNNTLASEDLANSTYSTTQYYLRELAITLLSSRADYTSLITSLTPIDSPQSNPTSPLTFIFSPFSLLTLPTESERLIIAGNQALSNIANELTILPGLRAQLTRLLERDRLDGVLQLAQQRQLVARLQEQSDQAEKSIELYEAYQARLSDNERLALLDQFIAQEEAKQRELDALTASLSPSTLLSERPSAPLSLLGPVAGLTQLGGGQTLTSIIGANLTSFFTPIVSSIPAFIPTLPILTQNIQHWVNNRNLIPHYLRDLISPQLDPQPTSQSTTESATTTPSFSPTTIWITDTPDVVLDRLQNRLLNNDPALPPNPKPGYGYFYGSKDAQYLFGNRIKKGGNSKVYLSDSNIITYLWGTHPPSTEQATQNSLQATLYEQLTNNNPLDYFQFIRHIPGGWQGTYIPNQGNLAEYIESGGIITQSQIENAVNTLTTLHSTGYAHGDLLIDKSQLSDFGIESNRKYLGLTEPFGYLNYNNILITLDGRIVLVDAYGNPYPLPLANSTDTTSAEFRSSELELFRQGLESLITP